MEDFDEKTKQAIAKALGESKSEEGEGTPVEKSVTLPAGGDQNVGTAIEKALTTNPATTGDVLIPDVYDQGIRDFVETNSPIYNALPKEEWADSVYRYREQNGLPVATVYAEMADVPAASNSTYAERFLAMKNIWVRGEISGQELLATRGLVNIYTRELRNSALAIIQKIEDLTVVGDESVNPNEFSGLLKQITNKIYVDSTANGTGTDTALTLAMLDLLLDSPEGGTPDILILSRSMRRKINSLMQAQVRYVIAEDISLNAGVRVPSFNGVPLVSSRGTIAALNNKIIAVERQFVGFKIQKPIGVNELAKVRDSVDYFVNTYMTLAVEGAARHHAVLVGADDAI